MRIVITGSHGTGKTTLGKNLFRYLQEEKMKIGVTGSHGTGKTTLSKLLAGKNNWRYLPESPLQAMTKGFPINEETPIETEIWIFAKQIEMETFTPESWVADKCLIDLLAYARYLMPKEKSLLETLTKIVKRNAVYDVVIYLPTGEFPIEDDGFRSTDPVFQEAIDKEITRIMREMNIEYHKIVGTREERLERAKIACQSAL